MVCEGRAAVAGRGLRRCRGGNIRYFLLTIYASWIILGLGVVNFVTAALIITSCRAMPGLPQLLKNASYKRFYKVHGYLWWIFWPSVVIHVIMAVSRFVIASFGG